MANEISYASYMSAANGAFNKGVGSRALRADQSMPGGAAQSGIATVAPTAVTVLDLMSTRGIALIANTSLRDSGDAGLFMRTITGSIIFAFLKLEEQYVIRLDPASTNTTYEFLSDGTGTGSCMYSIDIFED